MVGHPPFRELRQMNKINSIRNVNLDNNQFLKNSISHKELSDFFFKAQKDISTNSFENEKNKEAQDFNDLLNDWTETSQKILLMMNKKEKGFINNNNPKSLMAFGAMGAHINMALLALKATELDQ